MPTAEVMQYVPPVGVNMSILSPDEEQTLQKTMHRLAERVSIYIESSGRNSTHHKFAHNIFIYIIHSYS